MAASLGARAQDQAGGVPGVTSVAEGPEATPLLVAYVATMRLLSTIVLRRQDIG